MKALLPEHLVDSSRPSPRRGGRLSSVGSVGLVGLEGTERVLALPHVFVATVYIAVVEAPARHGRQLCVTHTPVFKSCTSCCFSRCTSCRGVHVGFRERQAEHDLPFETGDLISGAMYRPLTELSKAPGVCEEEEKPFRDAVPFDSMIVRLFGDFRASLNKRTSSFGRSSTVNYSRTFIRLGTRSGNMYLAIQSNGSRSILLSLTAER